MLVLLAAGAAAPAPARPREKDAWIRVTTDHFTLVSNAPEKKTVALGRDLERLRQAVTRTSQNMTVQAPVPTRIYVFKSDASLRPYKLDAAGEPRQLSGFFAAASDGNYVAIDASAGASSGPTPDRPPTSSPASPSRTT